jgi:hypothetical protein
MAQLSILGIKEAKQEIRDNVAELKKVQANLRSLIDMALQTLNRTHRAIDYLEMAQKELKDK